MADPNPASGLSGQDSASQELDTSKAATTISHPPHSSIYTDKVRRVKELEGELRVLKGQVAIALLKVRRAAEHEDFILEEISRASETMKCRPRKAPESFALNRNFTDPSVVQVSV